MNRSFQTKPQSYGVTQKEGSEELSSHTQHKCSLGAPLLCLARHSSIKGQPAGAGRRDTSILGMHFHGMHSLMALTCAQTTGMQLHSHRNQEQFTPTEGISHVDGFLLVSD